jgi:hypothetical protein
MGITEGSAGRTLFFVSTYRVPALWSVMAYCYTTRSPFFWGPVIASLEPSCLETLSGYEEDWQRSAQTRA